MKCNCQKCGIEYIKPNKFKIWNEEHPNTFFKLNLLYCDKCRKEKEENYLNHLPQVIEILSKNK
jgi:hypothetical protein